MKFDVQAIDERWQRYWKEHKTYRTTNDTTKPKYYVLDMFPYPSGAGLHVGHPLGYIGSDIVARSKRQQGFNVLHPMGFDAFGLPAEQYAIDTGVHPSVSTAINTKRYQEQMERLGLSYDWDRAVNTSDPNYYKWTQWIIGQVFEHWYDKHLDRARPIGELIAHLEQHGTEGLHAAESVAQHCTAAAFRGMSAKEQSDFLMNYRLAFRSVSYVNWCEALGTVLANDEVKDGRSERGNHPVVQKPMLQWSLRITAYAERLLQGLEEVDYSDGLKAQQRNWIGRSTGAQAFFDIQGHDQPLEVFTTRPDTIFGVTFMVIAPEHELVEQLTTPEQAQEIKDYLAYVGSRSEVDRQAETKVTGAFTGSYCINPLNGALVPIYIAEYVLKDYGTGAIMAVPSDDERDKRFAEKFGIEIIDVIDKSNYPGATLKDKVGILINSDFLNGMEVPDAIEAATAKLRELGRGEEQVNFRIRDLVFSRQRYWGEPWPIIYDANDVPHLVPEADLPVELPAMEDFRAVSGESPLKRATDWNTTPQGRRETDTMPATAGSNWYYLRYMDPHNSEEFVDRKVADYWQDVDLYVGGAEHAVSHILYSRLIHKFLFDLGKVPTQEPYRKLLNQGMIGAPITSIQLGVLLTEDGQRHPVWVGANVAEGTPLEVEGLGKGHLVLDESAGTRKVPLRIVEESSVNNIPSFRIYKEAVEQIAQDEAQDAAYFRTVLQQGSSFIWEKDKEGRLYLELSAQVGKMSKRYHNVINPDDISVRYGTDCFRMYEMFLGPIDQAKPWSVSGIDGVYRFLRRFWNLYVGNDDRLNVSSVAPSKEEMKVLHTLIKKVTEDIDKLSFNTCISAFMVAANELSRLKCNKEAVLEPMVRLIAPFAPHIAEELFAALGGQGSVHHAAWPEVEEQWLVEDSFTYPIAFNGKTKLTLDFPADATAEEVETLARANSGVQQQLEGKAVRKVIVVPKRMINFVVG
ncbi:class I tRNA ligase family protein [Neolewinella lacunae]|uniref:Leucine--tRNA ligase n=1 Tax=Neolewinella lacunae TaxID=1517758 RepID=A0A923T8U1_9BACT|nr:class I tRNA ligase family protein [Neolewinella lacunae]MBC6994333.1 leucine--tRNA ligase [Neolewinella lacunae]MDN3635820.1 class I tRNA ligase family protein [Neolewinella lacunae]